MIEAAIHEAKTKLTALLRQVEEGERVVITRHGKPIAEIVPYKKRGGMDLDRVTEVRRALGLSLEPGWIADDFDESLSDDDLNLDDPKDPLFRPGP